MEHPDRAASWSTRTWQSMDGCYDAKCDRCRTGLVYRRKADGKVVGKVKKSTRIRTTSEHLAKEMDLPCRCPTGEHVMMVGKSDALKKMQNYEVGFVRRAARESTRKWSRNWIRRETMNILVAEEVQEGDVEMTEEQEIQAAKTNTRMAKQVVAKLHRQLGHPNNDKLVRALRQAKMDEAIVACAKDYKCDVCATMKNKELDKPASLSQASHFNEIIEMDIFHLKWDGVKRRSLRSSMSTQGLNQCCGGQRDFGWGARGHHEAVGELGWFSETNQNRFFGSPHVWGFSELVRRQSHQAHIGSKRAHHRMGLVERLHAVRRQQLHKMKTEKPDLQLEVAVLHACSQRNRLRTVHGSSPAAIVFGFTPGDGGILDEPNALKPSGRPGHQEDEAIRHQAAKAFYEANHSTAVRRALLAKSRPEHVQHQVGDYVYYWRTSMTSWNLQGGVVQLWFAWWSRELKMEFNDLSFTGWPWIFFGASCTWTCSSEVGAERATRLETMPQTAVRQPLQEQLVQALQPVRGPVRFLNLANQSAAQIYFLLPLILLLMTHQINHQINHNNNAVVKPTPVQLSSTPQLQLSSQHFRLNGGFEMNGGSKHLFPRMSCSLTLMLVPKPFLCRERAILLVPWWWCDLFWCHEVACGVRWSNKQHKDQIIAPATKSNAQLIFIFFIRFLS